MTISMQDLHLMPALADAVADMGYTTATPIQAKAIPVILTGRDLIGCASTGTGKTAAFLLPILQRLAATSHVGCRALILSPTRELAMQIDEQALALGYHLGLSAVSVVGGVDMGPQEHALKSGSDIIVATPGRLIDHMRFGTAALGAVEVVVLDEADRMLDMGFLPDVNKILAALPATRQTLLFSATLSPKILALAETIMRDPITVMVDRQQPAGAIEHRTYRVSQERKPSLLASLLRPDEMRSVLVFVKRKIDADRLARTVTRSGKESTSIHSDRSQAERCEALEAFRRGDCPVLVATDVAGRGLDVSGISHVVNFDVPRSPEDYIHRAGRTARAGASGEVITFVSPDEEHLIAAIQAELGMTLPCEGQTIAPPPRAPAPRLHRTRNRRPRGLRRGSPTPG
ncbi:MAG TPA: DEAD/DEAH box helicase [Candidatus Dormibacteraeota bacterium]|nr:DEAD/DEAH box helicase [Candidatus Dormibacteraeota bacterium]